MILFWDLDSLCHFPVPIRDWNRFLEGQPKFELFVFAKTIGLEKVDQEVSGCLAMGAKSRRLDLTNLLIFFDAVIKFKSFGVQGGQPCSDDQNHSPCVHLGMLISTLENISPSISSASVYFADSSTTLALASTVNDNDRN
jgi:hypothetical protein